MESLTIELKNKNALSILKSLEKAQMIKLICKERPPKKPPVRSQGILLNKQPVDAANPAEIQNSYPLRTYGFAQDAIILQPDFDEPLQTFNE